MSRAIVFDLDDTLYSERRFALSGFAAVASQVSRSYGIPARDVFRSLVRSLKSGRRHVAFQDMCAKFDLSFELIPLFVNIVRTHVPRLRMPRTARRVLGELRKSWRVGVVTNGLPAVQARKSGALHLLGLVDQIVFAGLQGNGGKPAAAPFLEIARRLGAAPSQTVFVGDDPWCDVEGARRVGMKTIRVRQATDEARRAWNDADAVVSDLAEVPLVASRLLTEEMVDAY